MDNIKQAENWIKARLSSMGHSVTSVMSTQKDNHIQVGIFVVMHSIDQKAMSKALSKEPFSNDYFEAELQETFPNDKEFLEKHNSTIDSRSLVFRVKVKEKKKDK